MTKKFSILSIVVVLLLSVCLVSCGSSDSDSTAASSSSNATPVEALSYDEKLIFDAVINTTSLNQKDTRVLDCIGADDVIFVGIQSKNNTGGTISKWYYIEHTQLATYGKYKKQSDDDWKLSVAMIKLGTDKKISEIEKYAEGVVMKPFPDDSVGNINKALKFYWEEKGMT